MDEEVTISGVLWNLAGGRKIEKCLEFLKNFDIIVILEKWVEAEKDFIRKLDNDYIWRSKSAVRYEKKGRAKGGGLISGCTDKCKQ